MLLEACVETVDEAIIAEKSGAHRIELCADLIEDGLSPSFELISEVQKSINLPIKVMVRPRKGNFIYSDEEVDAMIDYALKCRDIGIVSIVTGMLTAENKVDIHNLKRLAHSIPNMDITFHKAIDLTDDPILEVMKMIPISNVKSILTSGKGNTAMEGLSLLRKLVNHFHSRFTIIAAGKITSQNIFELHNLLQGSAYHGRKIVV